MTVLNSFTAAPRLVSDVNLFGPQGRGDAGETFYKEWKARFTPKGVLVVGRKDGAPGCFSLVELSRGWDIAFYQYHTPTEVWDALTTGKTIDAQYFPSTKGYKWLYLNLLEILEKFAKQDRADDFYPLEVCQGWSISNLQWYIVEPYQKSRNGDRGAESELCNRLGTLRRVFPEKMPAFLKDQLKDAVEWLRYLGRTVDFRKEDPRDWISQRDGTPRW